MRICFAVFRRLSRLASVIRTTHRNAGQTMLLNSAQLTSEHELYLKLFITNGGGW
jgi:hypothetical protein